MAEYFIESDFRRGLDVRKFALGAPAGTLVECNDGHLTQAGDIEKRKGFPKFTNTGGVAISDAGEEGPEALLGPATFGLQTIPDGLLVFGSALPYGTAPTQSQPVLLNLFPTSSDPVVNYQQLQHPAVTEGLDYDHTKHRMSALVRSELFGGRAAAVAQFADGRRFLYYDGALVEDCAAGLVLEHLAGDNVGIAQHLARLLNLTGSFTGAQLVFESEVYSWAAGEVIVQVTNHGLSAGHPNLKVTSTGVAAYAVAAGDLTVVDANTLSYVFAINPGAGGTVGLTLTLNLVDVTGPQGVEFDVTDTVESAAGEFADPVAGEEPVAPVAGIAAVGSFAIMGGSADPANVITNVRVGVDGLRAWAQLFTDGGNFADGDTITIGAGPSLKTYTIRDVIAVNGDVLRDNTPSSGPPGPPPDPFSDWRTAGVNTLRNLVAAINHDTTVGIIDVKYKDPAAHADVYAEASPPPDLFAGTPYLTVRARVVGAAGNAIPVAATAQGDWDDATLHGGSGAFATEILGSPVEYQTDNAGTARAVAQMINNSSGVTGYTAAVGEGTENNRVIIYSADDLVEANLVNGFAVTVLAEGNVCVGDCVMTFAITGAAPEVVSLKVGGTEIAADVVFGSTLEQGYADLAAAINAGTTAGAAHGYLAYAATSFIRISKATTASTDGETAVDLTLTNLTVSFEQRITAGPLSVSLPQQSINTGDGWDTFVQGDNPVTAIPAGGSNSYVSFEWMPETPGGDVVLTSAGYERRFTATTPTYQATLFSIRAMPPLWGLGTRSYSARFVCKVTDSHGTVAVSNPTTITFELS